MKTKRTTKSNKCDTCGRTFGTQQGLHLHQTRTHGGEEEQVSAKQQTEADVERALRKAFDVHKTRHHGFFADCSLGPCKAWEDSKRDTFVNTLRVPSPVFDDGQAALKEVTVTEVLPSGTISHTEVVPVTETKQSGIDCEVCGTHHASEAALRLHRKTTKHLNKINETAKKRPVGRPRSSRKPYVHEEELHLAYVAHFSAHTGVFDKCKLNPCTITPSGIRFGYHFGVIQGHRDLDQSFQHAVVMGEIVGPNEPKHHRGVAVWAENGKLFVDGEVADLDELIAGLRLGLKVSR